MAGDNIEPLPNCRSDFLMAKVILTGKQSLPSHDSIIRHQVGDLSIPGNDTEMFSWLYMILSNIFLRDLC